MRSRLIVRLWLLDRHVTCACVCNVGGSRKDKDIFLDIYKSALSRRLLNKLSVSNDAEDCFITKLKVECGQQAIQKLASMFTDMALSDQLQEGYMKHSHQGSPGGVTHEVRVLQTNAWPEKADDVPIVPCHEMLNCIKAYEAFYHQKHNGRKLRWIYNMGQANESKFIEHEAFRPLPSCLEASFPLEAG